MKLTQSTPQGDNVERSARVSRHSDYLSDERDHRVAVRAVKVARRIGEAPSLARHIIDE